MLSFNIQSEYENFIDHFPNHNQRPVIGITGNFGDNGCELAEGYYRSIELSGGLPVILPPTDNHSLIASQLDRIDGLILSGGGDVNPLFMGEDPIPELRAINPKRDGYELLLTRLAYDRNIPMLGICRGMQVIAMALGGEVVQDIATCMSETEHIKHSQDAPRHIPTHRIETLEGSIVRQLFGEKIAVNSFHHQAVLDPGPRLRATAYAADGVIEAMESTEMKTIYGVQWHPECFVRDEEKTMFPLFRHFVEQSGTFLFIKNLHRDMLIIDSHCDTAMKLDEGANLAQRRDNVLVDLHRMTEGMLDVAFMAAFIPQGDRSAEGLADATLRCDNLLAEISRQVQDNYGASLSFTTKSIFQAKQLYKKSIVLAIENGYALGDDLSNIGRYRRMGVAYITLCHNGDNDICDSACKSMREHGGLSSFGREVVEEMNRRGVMIDLSHASEETFYDVLSLTTQPVICSHSSARALCNHPRNLTDEQLRALAENGGVAQATFYHGFLRFDGTATIDDAVDHILHMIDVAGIDHVGIGSDFDGDGGVPGLQSVADYPVLTRKLLAAGIAPKHLRKLWGGNLMRVMSRVQHDGYVKY